MKRSLFVLIGVSFTVGCSSMQRSSTANEEREAAINSSEVSSSAVESQLRQPYKSPLGDVPLTDNKMSRKWVKYFLGRGRHHMDRYLARSSRYIPMMKNVLREEGLPEDLVYVALIESGFNPKAHSHANAVGYWQFIRSTGKSFGLRIDGYIDERRDPVLSTRAAAAYFKALYNLFGSWHLSLAAYNTGENRVKNRVMRYYTRDFWELARRRALPRETRNYVPKFIAAAMIAKSPESYGFSSVTYQVPLSYDAVEASNPISLKALSAKLGVDHDEIKRLNPKFRGDYVPNYKGDKMMIRVPKGFQAQAAAAIPAVKVDRPQYVYRDHYYYRVRRGDTLGHIARRHRTTVGTLRRMNKMGRRSMIRVGQRLKVPERGGYSKHRVASQSRSRKADPNATYHTVRRGENLTLIARKYGMSVQELKKLNSLNKRALLKVGQRLKLRENKPANSDNQSYKSGSSHIVQRGENLTLIAKKYRVSVQALKQANGFGRRSILKVGQKLSIPGQGRGRSLSAKNIKHRVKQGENLTLIARKYGVSVSDLRRANHLDRKSILFVGKKLEVPVDNVHVVRRGENLSLIADRYKVSVRKIVKANNLRQKSLIAAGQALVIPD